MKDTSFRTFTVPRADGRTPFKFAAHTLADGTVQDTRISPYDAIKKAEKAKEITEDESKKGVDDVQKLTDKIIKEIDAVAANKEKEVMEI